MPKEVIKKNYECFKTGDMKTFVSLYHENAVLIVNGKHRFPGTHKGIKSWIDVLAQIPARYDNFSVSPENMIYDGDQVFTQLHAKADEMDANFGHFHKLVNGKIKEMQVYDDSQQMAQNMKEI